MGSDAGSIGFCKEALWMLDNYDWPGNIRELENAIVRAVALSDQIVRPEDLPERVRRSFKKFGKENNGDKPAAIEDDEILLPLSEVERRHILRVLSRTGGNKQAAARILAIDRTTLQRKLERYEVEGSNGTSATD